MDNGLGEYVVAANLPTTVAEWAPDGAVIVEIDGGRRVYMRDDEQTMEYVPS